MGTSHNESPALAVRRSAVFLLGIVVCLVAVVHEFAFGEGSLVDIAALLVGFVALFGSGNVIAERGYQFGRYAQKVESTSWLTRIGMTIDRHRRLAWTVAVALAVILGSGAYLLWFYSAASSRLVTLDVGDLAYADLPDCFTSGPSQRPERLETCTSPGPTLRLPGEPPDRGHVTVVAHLTNQSDNGSCVDPARIVVTPVEDGRPGEVDRVRSGAPAIVSIADASHEASVEITVDQLHDDPACKVDLRIVKVILHD